VLQSFHTSGLSLTIAYSQLYCCPTSTRVCIARGFLHDLFAIPGNRQTLYASDPLILRVFFVPKPSCHSLYACPCARISSALHPFHTSLWVHPHDWVLCPIHRVDGSSLSNFTSNFLSIIIILSTILSLSIIIFPTTNSLIQYLIFILIS